MTKLCGGVEIQMGYILEVFSPIQPTNQPDKPPQPLLINPVPNICSLFTASQISIISIYIDSGT